MSNINNLIQRYCPNGCEYKPLSQVAQRLKGSPVTAGQMKGMAVDDGSITIFGGGATKVQTDEEHTSKFNIITVPSVLVKSRGVVDFEYCNFPYTFKQEMWAYKGLEDVDTKFLYYYLKTQVDMLRYKSAVMGSMPQIKLEDTETIEIPIPPLPVQEEIVRILDKFTELETELETELGLRKQQYEYYRDKMLSLENVEMVTLKSITDVRDGTHDSPKSSDDDNAMYLLTSKNVKNGVLNYDGAYKISRTDYDAINQRSKVDTFDLLFTMIGTVGEVGLVTEEPNYAIKNVGLIKTGGNELLSKFIKYYLTTSMAKQYINANKSKGSQVFLALGKLRAFPIPKLDEDKMRTIVEKLDKFSTLTTDLSEGLPAEIKLRKQQYEYYRDKLLNFNKLEVVSK